MPADMPAKMALQYILFLMAMKEYECLWAKVKK